MKLLHHIRTLSFILLSGSLSAPVCAASSSLNTVVTDPFFTFYPFTCAGPSIDSGICLLGSIEPKTEEIFIARGIADNTGNPEYIVELNKRTYLPPGKYKLFRKDGFDSGHETIFSVQKNQIFTLKTATIRFHNTAGTYQKLQHFQARDGINGAGCSSVVGAKGAQAVLPGNYFVRNTTTMDNSAPKCEHEGTAFNIMAGHGVALHSKTVTEQTPSPLHIYRHSSSGVSLTNIDPQRHDVREIAFIAKFQQHNGIYNPSSTETDAMVFKAAPHFYFVIPVKMNRSDACGATLEVGGVPSRDLMTDCVFDKLGNLTKFRVNAGSYFGLNNLYGKSGVSSHTINSPFIVSGVKFNLKGNRQ